MDARTSAGLNELAAIAEASGSTADVNGLTLEENQRLAVTHRPTEIASLVILGLGRLRAQSISQ
jgi:hypothetical protein